jgi:integrase
VVDLNGRGLVFTTEAGGPLEARNVTRSFKRFLVRHKLRELRFHDLRHTHATLCLLAHISAKVVQERLGHSSIKITIDTYQHVIDSMDRDAAEQLEAALA